MSGQTNNSIYIEAPLELVWEVTNDLTRWPQLFTEYASVEILNHHDQTFRFRLTMHPDDEGNTWSWVSERTLDPIRHHVSAQRIELGWFEHMLIRWTFAVEGSGTRMRWMQDFAMNARSPVNTGEMTTRINTGSVTQMAHIRDQIEHLGASTATMKEAS